MNGLSIVIPVYNEEQTVESTVNSLISVIKKAGLNWEIIAVNDGSEDGSGEKLERFDEITVLSHRTNRGYGAALKTGISLAQYADICITDADGTYPNERITELYRTFVEKGLDMVVGARVGGGVSYPILRRIPKFFISRLANYICGKRIPDLNSGFRIFKKDVAVKFFNLCPDGFSFTTTITLGMLCKGYDIDFVPINYNKRKGNSKISPMRDTLGFFYLLSQIAVFFNPFKIFFPAVVLLSFISMYFLIRDVFVVQNLSQGSVLFPILTLNLFFMGLLADMISKK